MHINQEKFFHRSNAKKDKQLFKKNCQKFNEPIPLHLLMMIQKTQQMLQNLDYNETKIFMS